jgi:mannosyltransferase
MPDVAPRGTAGELAARWAPVLVPAAATLVALLLGLHRIGERSIWLDESASIYVAETDPARFLELISHSKLNMSLYFIALRAWTVLGSGEGIVRVLGVLFAAGAIPFLYLVVRRLIDARIAALAAFGLALNAFFIEWAQQARGYGLGMLLASASTYFLVRLTEDPRRRWWLAYGVVAGLGLYAHVFAALVIIGHGLALLLCWREWPILRRATLAAVVAAVVSAPMLFAVGIGRASALDWIGDLTLNSLRITVRNMSGGGWAYWLYLAGVLLSLAVLAAWLRRRDPRARGLVLLLCWALVPFALSVAVSLVKPVLVPRYLLLSLPAVAAVVVIGFVGLLRQRWLVIGTGVAVLLVTAMSLPGYYNRADRNNFRGLTAALAREDRPGDAITWWATFHSRPSVYYARRLGLTDLPRPIAARMRWEGNPYAGGTVDEWPEDCRPARIWLVGGPRQLPQAAQSGRAATVLTLLAEYEQIGATRDFGRMLLRLFERQPDVGLPTCST